MSLVFLTLVSKPRLRSDSPDVGMIIWLTIMVVTGVIVTIIFYRNKKNRERPILVQAAQPQIIQMVAPPVSININNNVAAASSDTN